MKDSDFTFLARLLELALKDSSIADIQKVKTILNRIERKCIIKESKSGRNVKRQKAIDESNQLIESGQLKLGSKVGMFYNHQLVYCHVVSVPLPSSKYLKVKFINYEAAGAKHPIKYMPREHFDSLVPEDANSNNSLI